MKIAVIGMGYVGLTTAAALAHIGHEIFGVEIDEDKLKLTSDAMIPVLVNAIKELKAEIEKLKNA